MVKATFYWLFFVFLCTFTGLFFYYGFLSPDPSDCFYIKGVEAPERVRSNIIGVASLSNIKVSQGYPLNMARTFRVWFITGFFGLAILLGLQIPLSQVKPWRNRTKVDQGMLLCL